jgi:hypothetical protein
VVKLLMFLCVRVCEANALVIFPGVKYVSRVCGGLFVTASCAGHC